jgi:FkbM family methyltransferase
MKKIAFDIGANRGNMTDHFLSKGNKVICFEPNPDLVNWLRSKYKNNQNVIIEDIGLSDKIETKIFNLSNADTISTFSNDWINNSRFTGQYAWNRQIEVKTTTLDQIIDQYGQPEFIKIDVEGYELNVIKGLTKLLENTTFSFEWAEEQYDSMKQIYEYLISLGYEKYAFTYSDTITENLNWSKWENLDLHRDIDINRKNKWGMIYFKK